MPTPKRLVRIVLRCIPVVIALGFLVFYVGRAQRKRSEMFSSSKNLRALSIAGDQYFLEQPSRPVANPPSATPPLSTLSPPFSTSPEPALPTDIVNDDDGTGDPFSLWIFPPRPTTLGGSKSAVPVIEAPDFLRLWSHPPTTTYHAYELPFLRALPNKITLDEPSVRVHTDAVAEPSGLKSPAASPTSTPSPTTP